jgi:hypothetical protein
MSSLHSDKGWLFIAFRLGGRQVRLYLGSRAVDTRENMRAAAAAIKEVRELIAGRQWGALAERFPASKHLASFRAGGRPTLGDKDLTNFRQASEEFLAYQANINKRATIDFYRTILKTHLWGMPFADKPLKLIGVSDIAALYGPVAQRGHAPQAQNIRRVISAVFNWARGERGSDGEYLVADNPVTRTRPIIVERDEEDEVDPFTADEVERIIAACRPG